ncbi:MAG: hypothetical protein A4S09_14465 [Proteobacteria bacterium SG_bin7]|nr:MAG: hypothetical protein A4S09_14465 [Proteobacteria bacterium SG_bin7]
MRIHDIDLYNYRNFDKLHLSFNDKCNLFVGENGHGKTNLLESLYMMGRGNSFRPTETKSFVNYESVRRESFIRGTLINKFISYNTQILIQDTKKKFRVNGKPISSTGLARILPVILFSPESLSSIKGSSSERRNLLDEMILLNNPENADILIRYQKALRARNRVLKDYASEHISKSQFEDVFTSITEPFIQAAVDLTFVRIVTIRQMASEFQNALTKIFSYKVPSRIDYLVSSKVANDLTYEQIHDALHKRSLELRVAEVSSATSLVGPHRHDVEIYFDEKNSRFYCSQGQQRALILALKFAQIMYHHKVFQKYPVLLLDDVLSELDLDKKMNLLDLVGQVDAQVFLTTTDRRFQEILKTEKYSLFEINKGIVTRK